MFQNRTISYSQEKKAMSMFSDLLGQHIAAKGTKSNEMAQFCGIERSFMYKIIKGTRHVASMDTVLLTLSNPTRFPSMVWKTTTAGKISLNYLKTSESTLRFILLRIMSLYPVFRILRASLL